MAEFIRPSGVRVRTAPSLTVDETLEQFAPTGTRRRRVPDVGVPRDGEFAEGGIPPEAVVASLEEDLELIDVIPIMPTIEPTEVSGRRTRGGPPAPGRSPVAFDVDVEEGESAVLLVEQDGVYTWVTTWAQPVVATPG